MATQFACPSPTGRNNQQLFLTKAGVLTDKHGRAWGASSIRRMAQDAALPATNFATGGEKDGKKWTPADWQAAHTRHSLDDALEEACTAHGLDDEQHKELRELVRKHLSGEAQEDKGMGATDDDVDEDAVEERVREFLSSKGLDDQTISEALKRVKADRAAAKDRLPLNGLHGTGGQYKSRPERQSLRCGPRKGIPRIFEYDRRPLWRAGFATARARSR